MERITLRVSDDLLSEVEGLVHDGEFRNRSAAIRAGIRQLDGVDASPRALPDGGTDTSGIERTGLPLRNVGVECGFCGCEKRRPDSNRCAGCGRFASDPRYAYSKLTDTWYRVTEYDVLDRGRIQAREKEEVPRDEVPEAWLEAVEERDRDD
jgi:hypothetical protein